MDLTQLLAWIVGANTIINFSTTIYTLMSARATKALEGIKGLTQKIEDLAGERQKASEEVNARFVAMEARMVRMESDMQHLPDREQAHRLELLIQKLTGSMEALDERLTGRMDTLDEKMKPVAAVGMRLLEIELDKANGK